jgi:hypothetical protein
LGNTFWSIGSTLVSVLSAIPSFVAGLRQVSRVAQLLVGTNAVAKYITGISFALLTLSASLYGTNDAMARMGGYLGSTHIGHVGNGSVEIIGNILWYFGAESGNQAPIDIHALPAQKQCRLGFLVCRWVPVVPEDMFERIAWSMEAVSRSLDHARPAFKHGPYLGGAIEYYRKQAIDVIIKGSKKEKADIKKKLGKMSGHLQDLADGIISTSRILRQQSAQYSWKLAEFKRLTIIFPTAENPDLVATLITETGQYLLETLLKDAQRVRKTSIQALSAAHKALSVGQGLRETFDNLVNHAMVDLAGCPGHLRALRTLESFFGVRSEDDVAYALRNRTQGRKSVAALNKTIADLNTSIEQTDGLILALTMMKEDAKATLRITKRNLADKDSQVHSVYELTRVESILNDSVRQYQAFVERNYPLAAKERSWMTWLVGA